MVEKEETAKMKKIIFGFLFLIFFSVIGNAQSDFQTSSLIVKASAKLGEVQTKSITINSKTSGDFLLSVDSVKGAKLKENIFALNDGDEKNVEIRFDSESLEPGVYVGALEIKGPKDSARVPVIFEVESEDVLFDANVDIPPAYNVVEQGSKLTYQIKIFDLSANGDGAGQGAVNVAVNYIVYSLDGKVLTKNDENLLVDEQSQLTSAIGFPNNIEPGTYVLAAIVKYKSSVGTTAQIFEIKKAEPREIRTNIPDFAVISAVIFSLIIFFGTIILFIYLLKERDRALRQLKTLNEQETEAIAQLLKEQKEIVEEKGGIGKEIDREIQLKLADLRRQQQNRVYEIQKLNNSGNKKEMERKLREWREKGYNTSVMDFKLANLTNAEMKQLLQRWKRKYGKRQKNRKKPKS